MRVSKRKKWSRFLIYWPHIAFLLLLLLPSHVFSAVTDPSSVDEQDEAVFSRVTAYFANIPEYKQPCNEIELPNKIPIFGLFLTIEEDKDLDTKFGEYKYHKAKIEAKRREVRQAAEKMLDAALTYYRSKDQGYLDWKSTELDFHYYLYAWLWHLWDLESKEKELRKATVAYYAIWSKAFGQMSRKDQEKVLKDFEKRALCLQAERRNTFDKLQDVRMELWDLARSSNFNIIDNAGLTLKLTNLEQAYAWLVPEQSTHKSIFANLLTSFDRSLRNRDLFDELLKAYRQQPYLSDSDPIPAMGQNHSIRLRILKARARKALLALHMQDIKIEAAYTGQLSMTAGFRTGLDNISEAGQKAINDIWTATELTSKRKFSGLGPQVQALALLGGAYKYLGSSFSILVSTPVKDAFTEAIFKPLGDYVGVEIKNSMESALTLYKQQRHEIDVRIKLLQAIGERTTTIDEGKAFINDIKTGGGFAGGAKLPARPPWRPGIYLKIPILSMKAMADCPGFLK